MVHVDNSVLKPFNSQEAGHKLCNAEKGEGFRNYLFLECNLFSCPHIIAE